MAYTNSIISPDAGWYREDTRDWTLDGANDNDIRDRLRAYKPKSDYQYEWNQARDPKTRSFCTAFAPMCAILSYKEKDRGSQQWHDFFEWARENHGYREGVGNWMTVGMVTAVGYRNHNHPDDPLVFYNLKRNTEDFRYALSLGYRLVIGGKYNKEYQVDRRVDRIINKVSSRKKKDRDYGHIFTTIGKGKNLQAIDNYKGRKDNIYTIPRDLVDDVARGSDDVGFYPSAYVITSAKVMSDDDNGLTFDTQKKLQTLMQARSTLRQEIEKTDIREQLHKENNRYRKHYNL